MLDYPQFKLPEIILDRKYLDDAVSTLLNLIFFHRALGPITLNHVRCELLPKVSQLIIGEPQVDKDIKKVIEKINKDVKLKNYEHLQISLKFMEEQQTTILQFYKPKHKVFEEWQLPFQFGESNIDKQQEDLNHIQTKIIDIATANYDHFDEHFDQSQPKPLKYPYELTYNLL